MEMQCAWPWTACAAQISATAYRRGVRTCQWGTQAPSHVTAREGVETLWREWSSREDCFRQGPRDPEYYDSPEGGAGKREQKNKWECRNSQEDVSAWEPRDKTVIQDKTKCLRTNYGPITSCRKKRLKAEKLDRWWLLFVYCSPLFILTVLSTLSEY